MSKNIRRLALLGVMAAVTVVIIALFRIPLIPSSPWLEYDGGDIPILFTALYAGPWYGLLLTAVASVIQGVTVSSQSGPIGILMHFFATGAFVLTAGLITRKNRSSTVRAAVGIICGGLAMTAIMIPLNLILTPLFSGLPVSAIIDMLPTAILPFNLIKAGLNGVLTLILHAVLKRPLSKYDW